MDKMTMMACDEASARDVAILLALSTMALAESAEPEAPAVELEEFTIGDEVEAAPAEETAKDGKEALAEAEAADGEAAQEDEDGETETAPEAEEQEHE